MVAIIRMTSCVAVTFGLEQFAVLDRDLSNRDDWCTFASAGKDRAGSSIHGPPRQDIFQTGVGLLVACLGHRVPGKLPHGQ
mmetsp:Transcript_17782/g.26875  ORF Transcript_17782/g.26875 Transcript_17782/m.26875 type:complete len:81 (-) Transcript_17782:320-562(-)